jgi:long-chain acyl-CoA synthetase
MAVIQEKGLTGYPSIDKPWLKYYEEKQTEISIPECSIYECMYNHARGFDRKSALEYLGKQVSYKKLFAQIALVSKSLKALGVKQGDVVSVCLPNVPEAVYSFYAINRIGAVANMLDVRCAGKVLESAVTEAKSDVLIVLDSVADKFTNLIADDRLKAAVAVSPVDVFGPVLKSVIRTRKPELRTAVPSGFISWRKFLSFGKGFSGVIDGEYIKDADAVVAYTGGTTGEPKGVVGTNETVNAVVEMELNVGFNESVGDSLMDIAPPWTYYGICNSLNVPLCMGLKVLLIPNLEATGLGSATLKLRPNHIITVPSSMHSFITCEEVKRADLSFIKSIILGADKLDESFENEINDFLKMHNCAARVSKGYGMTEVMAAAAYTKANANEPGSVGIPYPGNVISAFECDNDQSECIINETGEIAISGPTIMKTYFGKAKEENANIIKIHADGSKWIHTGDIGHVGLDGRIYIDGRLKRMFVKNGYKIFPSNIEHCIMKCNGVSSAAVIAIQSDSFGNKTKAYVVVKDKQSVENTDVRRQIEKIINDELFDYEYPDVYEFIDELPLTNMGKVDYAALEKRASGLAQ